MESLSVVLVQPLVWIIVLGAVAVLAFVLRHERRQARRLAERTKELEHLSTELIRVNRMKSEFLANVSHELRTPLNAIVGFVDLLREGVYGELAPRQVKPVERIEASANHLRHLVDQVLDLAKMAAGRLEVHLEPVDIKPFVLDVTSEVESLVSEKKLTLSLVLGGSLPKIRTDPTHLRQILVNLIGNSVKYTDRGSIVVRARAASSTDVALPAHVRTAEPNVSSQWLALEVADTGHGIAPMDQERIFQEFEQANEGSRSDSAGRGTGLGLAISRRLARLLGGDVGVESEVGRGSTFTLWLPAVPSTPPATSRLLPDSPEA